MLKAVEAPLPCFGLDFDPTLEMCQTCPHQAGCRDYMGGRVERVTVGQVIWSLVPATIERRGEEQAEERRDIQAIYCECYRQVFNASAIGAVGQFEHKLFELARAARVPVESFILISMFGHSRAYPEAKFMPKTLVDNRSLNRVKVYAEECKRRYGAFSAKLLDVIADSNLDKADLQNRMLASEKMAGDWIVSYKLWHQGLPYTPMFDDIEANLDPAWLATEKHYEPVLTAYSTRTGPQEKQRQAVRHQALEIYQRLKKHKHEAIANFRAREKIMPVAVRGILANRGFGTDDFEIPDNPVNDPLLFWNRLATAIQHLECLLFVNYHEGIYARS